MDLTLCLCVGCADIDCMSGEEVQGTGCYMVMLNGYILGVHRAPHKFVRQIRLMRRSGLSRLSTLSLCLHIFFCGDKFLFPFLMRL